MVDTQFAPLYDKIAFFSSQPARRHGDKPETERQTQATVTPFCDAAKIAFENTNNDEQCHDQSTFYENSNG